ncbi:MAG TPA: hypothetical protein DDZ89_21830, partial [Clostridiales bacterium]|nr:hypothetical protein [Clostridiales bacterium]
LPPHLKLLGVERDPEFTFSLLDKIEEEFQRRMELFKSKGVNNITEYKQRYGVRSLPRIIFIVDEFHHMTQAIQNEPRYVVILENILSEYRVFGLSCVFSDQAISVGLRGLTEKGKNQISIRIAMENEIPEIRSTLALANNLYDDSMNHRLMNMTEGDVIFKRFSASNQEMILDLYKTIYITKDERSEVIRQANLRAQGNYVPKDLLIIDGQNRREYEESEVVDFENKQCVDTTRQIPIYMGTPINFAPCFFVFLRKKTDSNILVIGADDEIRASILLHTIYSFKRQPNTSVVVFADPDDEIYRQYKGQLKELLDSHDDLIFDMSFVCEKVDHLSKYMNPDNDRRILICWLGLEEIADYLSVQGERNRVSKDLAGSGSVSTSSLDSLIGDVDAL